MARPGDWWVLDLEKDPTPGDPSRVETLANRFLEFSEVAERAYRSVTSLQGDSAVMSWVGLSGDAFRDHFGGFPDQLRKLYTSHQMCGDALTEYGPQLEMAQAQADRALADGREARSRLDSATSGLTTATADAGSASSHADSVKTAPAGAPPPDPDQVAQAVRDAQVAQERQSAAQGAVNSAQAALDAAKSLAEQARGLRTSAAETCATKINDGSDAGIQPRSFWQKLAEAFKKLWDIICEIAKWVALVAGIIAMIIGGPLAWVAFAAGVILLIKAVVDYAQGHGSIMDLVFGIIGIIPGVKGLTSIGKLKELYKVGGLKAIGANALKNAKSLVVEIAQGLKNAGAGLGQIIQKGLGDVFRKINPLPIGTSKGAKGIPAAGDPVDVSTGRMFLTQNDLHLPGTLPLVLERTHRSDYRLGRSFGPSWASWLDQRLMVELGSVHLLAADGMLLTYPEPSTASVVLPIHGPSLPLRRTDDGFVVDEPGTGRTLTFGLPDEDGTAPLVAVADRAGNRIEVLRDELNTALEVRHSGGYRVSIDSAPNGRVTALHVLPRSTDGELIETDAHGSDPVLVSSFEYDEKGFLSSVLDPSDRPMRFEYDDSGRIVRWEDRNGMWYRYEYDTEGRCVRSEGRDGALAYRFTYDRESGVTEAIDSFGARTVYRLNDDLQVVAQIDPLGATTLSEWDIRHQLLARTDAVGATTRYTYDTTGDLLLVEGPDGVRTAMEYAAPGLVSAVTGPDGSTWRRQYDATGGLVAETDPTGVTYRYGFDPAGSDNGLGTVESVDRDAAGLPVSITDGSGTAVQVVRDRFGRPVEVVNAQGERALYRWTVTGELAESIGPDGGRRSWTYDGEQNLTSFTDEAGHTSWIEYAGYDLPVAHIDPSGARTQYTYDTELRLTSVTDPVGRVWLFEYDAAGRLAREVDFDGREQLYGYDPAGRLVREVDPAGQVTEFDLDLRGNLVERRTADGVSRFRRDLVGRVVQATSADADVMFERDRLGRIVAETVNGRTVRTRHDVEGRVTERLTPSGAASAWTYDPAGRPLTMLTGGHVLQFGYDQSGHEIYRQLDAGVLLAGDVDAAGRALAQTVIAGDLMSGLGRSRTVHHHAVTRAPGGRPTSVDDGVLGVRTIDTDTAGRITALHGPGGAESYTYNSRGDITAATGPDDLGPDQALGSREYDGSALVRSGTVRFGYDERGHTISRTEPTADGGQRQWQYTWNAEGRLTAATTADGERWHYRYDAFGRRIAKERTVLGETGRERIAERIEFTWVEDSLVEQVRTGADRVTRLTSWERHPSDDRPLTQSSRELAVGAVIDEQFTAVLTDPIGTPTGLVTADGEVTWQRTGTLWGQDAPGTPAGIPLRMPGQYLDAETGLHYNHQRYYDPSTGRYLSPDPLGLAPALNPLTYVRNPLTQADPLGLAPVCPDNYAWFSNPNRNYITEVGEHRVTKGFSQQYVRESEHVMPWKAISDSGIPTGGPGHEITVSMPYHEHQWGSRGRGGGVSSTGSSLVAKGWSGSLAGLLQAGRYQEAYTKVVVDALNVNRDAAPGMLQFLDEVGRGTGLPAGVPPRLTQAEVQAIREMVIGRYGG